MPHHATPTRLETGSAKPLLRRFAPLAVIVVLIAVVYAMGWHRAVSIETLVRHRTAIDTFMQQHYAAALGLFGTRRRRSCPGP